MWWKELFAPKELDPGDLEVESNYRRFLQANLQIRITATATKLELDRVLLAIKRSGFNYPISVDPNSKLKLSGNFVTIESARDFQERVVKKPSLGLRIWQVGQDESWVKLALPNPDIHLIRGEVLVSGRLTGLNLVREQAISITQHRFGAVSPRVI